MSTDAIGGRPRTRCFTTIRYRNTIEGGDAIIRRVDRRRAWGKFDLFGIISETRDSMQVSLDRIEFYEPDPKAPNLPRLSTLAIPRNEVLSAPDERAEQPRLCGKDPTWEGVIVISDNDGSDGESSSDGDARSSTSRPRPEKQASLPNGCLRADAASSYDRGFPLMQCTLQTPSSSPQQTLFPAPGAPAFEDDTNMQRTQSPSMPLSGTAYDTLHLLSRHAGSLPHSSGNTSRGSSVEPDIEAQERWLLPSPSDRQVLDQIIDGTADKGAAGANTCATGNARTRGIATPSSSSHQSSDRDSVTDRERRGNIPAPVLMGPACGSSPGSPHYRDTRPLVFS
ncbi:hypothetical protein HYQ44_010883 [Verticillium longisporum]|nr:hypothetical protein HYQ44_010883 [Verticillium longisporum]